MQEQANFWGCKGFLPEFPQTCPKSFCEPFACKFSPTKIMKIFLVWPQRKGLHVLICKRWAPFVWNQTMLGAIFARKDFADFQEFFPDFRQIKTFGNTFALTAPPPPTSLNNITQLILGCTIIRDEWITIIRLWWLSEWLVAYVHHLPVTIIYMWRYLQAATTRWPPWSFINPIWHSSTLCLHWSAFMPL